MLFKIAGGGTSWSLTRDGGEATGFGTQEAAFEAAVAEASNVLRAGNEVVIEVGRDADAQRTGASPDPDAS
jgi:hypothetical protein